MPKESKMDFIYTDGQTKILIESVQNNVRKAVINQYVACRKSKGMTQTDLSKKTGISQPNITRFESGNYNPSLEMLVKMAEALDMQLFVELREKTK
ncbi:MAG: helix-turn-helix transcriptional regulator [Firmicutes bacterium]|nr:helix-turn-helix transcriptional regulator [Bacillota bacterium]